MRLERDVWRVALVASAAASVALAFGACGSKDEDSNASRSVAIAPADPSSFSGRLFEREIYANYARFNKAMLRKDAAAVCESMTPKMQREIGAGKTCVERLGVLFAQSRLVEDPSDPEALTKETVEARFISLKRQDGKARAIVKSAANGKHYLMEFARHKDQWKFDGDGDLTREDPRG